MACGAWPMGTFATTRVGGRVDRGQCIGVFESHVDARAVARGPHAVRQLADGNGRHLREVVGAEHLDLVEAAHGHVGEAALGGASRS